MDGWAASGAFAWGDDVVFFGLALVYEADFAFHGVFFGVKTELAFLVTFYHFNCFDWGVVRNDAGFVDLLAHFDESIVFDELSFRELKPIFDSNKDYRVETFSVEHLQCLFEDRMAGFRGNVSLDGKDI
jgi:hypothetical protein